MEMTINREKCLEEPIHSRKFGFLLKHNQTPKNSSTKQVLRLQKKIRKRKDGRKIGLDRVLVEDGRRKAGVQSAVHDPQPDKIRNTLPIPHPQRSPHPLPVWGGK